MDDLIWAIFIHIWNLTIPGKAMCQACLSSFFLITITSPLRANLVHLRLNPHITVDTVLSSLQVWVSFDPIYCSDRSAEYCRQVWLTGGPSRFQNLLWHGHGWEEDQGNNGVLDLLRSPELCGLEAVRPLSGWSHIHIPGELLWTTVCMLHVS